MQTTQTVLIAGFSGRALAASARKAGLTPLVIDGFADTDTKTIAHTYRHIPSAAKVGFRRKSLSRALAQLSEAAPTPPIGLVLGTGFEDCPDLVEALESEYEILGNSAATIKACKSPSTFFNALRERGIPHPETSSTRPNNPAGWITKRVGGCGGLHIEPVASTISQPISEASPKPAQKSSDPAHYYQRTISGRSLSLAGAVSKSRFAVGLCEHWLAPTTTRPFRFGGLVSNPEIDADSEARMIDTAVELTRAFNLQGFVSFDFVATKSDLLLLEINPRPTAAIDILDEPDGRMFKAHILACTGNDPTEFLTSESRPPPPGQAEQSRAMSYVYADHGDLTVPEFSWPAWTTDRPAPGTKIRKGHPVATVTAGANTADKAAAQCLQRQKELESLLYSAAKKPSNNAPQ